jgi:hypothetical protein
MDAIRRSNAIGKERTEFARPDVSTKPHCSLAGWLWHLYPGRGRNQVAVRSSGQFPYALSMT